MSDHSLIQEKNLRAYVKCVINYHVINQSKKLRNGVFENLVEELIGSANCAFCEAKVLGYSDAVFSVIEALKFYVEHEIENEENLILGRQTRKLRYLKVIKFQMGFVDLETVNELIENDIFMSAVSKNTNLCR